MSEPCENCGRPTRVLDIERDGVPDVPGEHHFTTRLVPGPRLYEAFYFADIAVSTAVACYWQEHTPQRCRDARRQSLAS